MADLTINIADTIPTGTTGTLPIQFTLSGVTRTLTQFGGDNVTVADMKAALSEEDFENLLKGTYDDGMSYVSAMTRIFGGALDNNSFIGIDDDTCDDIQKYIFESEQFEDNRKCWFFSDDYNTGYSYGSCTETPSATTEFREVDITDKICDLSGVKATSYFNVEDVLTEKNTVVKIGKDGNDSGHCRTDMMTGYGRTSSLNVYDPETGKEDNKNTEASCNSVVNVKNIEIDFSLPNDLIERDPELSDDEKRDYRRYIENAVIPYLTQLMPSTCILKWNFNM